MVMMVTTPARQLASFDTDRFPFQAMFLNRVQGFLETQGLPAIACLENLHSAVTSELMSALYADLYQFVRGSTFRDCYRSFVYESIFPLFDTKVFYQRIPGIRIHTPGTLTVQYHSDEWYGHGPEVSNFWMPLTEASQSNTLWVASLEDSVHATRELELRKASMSEMNVRLAAISKPVETDFGHFYVFNSRTIHGSETNRTGKTRVSLDFRTLAEGADAGSKQLDEYYETDAVAATHSTFAQQPRSAVAYIFPKHGFTRFVGASNQRLVCAEYARQHQIILLAEETEIKTMPHHPILLDLAARKGSHAFEAVVLYSVLCLPENAEDRTLIYQTAERHQAELLFANEQMRFPGSPVEEIEKSRQELRG